MKLRTVLAILLVVVVLASIFALAGCNLFKSVTANQSEANLKNAGYDVTVMTGAQYVASDDADPFIFESELNNYIYAKKGDEVIYLFFFTTVNNASSNYDRMSIDYNSLRSGQSNELVYFGTKQAIADCGL